MFDTIRKRQRLFLAIILLLILPAFGLFGVSGYQSFMSDGDSVATVDGQKIGRQEFDIAQRRQLENLRQMFGNQLDPALLDTPAARKEVLEGLISQRALLNEAAANHMQVSDEALRAAIIEIPGLRKPDGSFDRDNYRMLLAGQNLTEAGFESQMRRDLAIQALPESIVSTAIVPKTVIDQVAVTQGETRDVRELLFKPDQYAAQVKPTDEQLKKFYDDNAKAFESPESLKVEYVMLDPLALASQVPLDEARIKNFYEQNKARYSVAEQRQASHILLTVAKDADQATRDKVRAKAEDLLKQLRGGADFAALAKAQSQDPGSAAQGGDLGLFAPEMMVKPFSDAAFALKPGELSDVVSSEFGYHIIKLTKVQPGSVKPFEAVRPEIEAEFRRNEAATLFAKDAEAFTNTVYEQSDSLKPAADKFKLKIETVDKVLRTGPDGGAPGAPLSNPKLLAALFGDDSLKKHRNTEAVEIASQALVSARVVEHRPAQRKPFDDVQADIRKALVAKEAQRLAVEAGKARLKLAQEGGKVDDFSEAKPVKRSGGSQVISVSAIEPVFKASSSKLPAVVGVDLGAAGYGLYQVTKVVPPDDAALAAQRPTFQQQLTQLGSQAELTEFLESLKARSKVKRNLSVLASKSDADK